MSTSAAMAAGGFVPPSRWIGNGASGNGLPGSSTNMQLLNAFGVSMQRNLPGVAVTASTSHQDSAVGIVIPIGIAGFEGSIDSNYYFPGDPLFIRAFWPNMRYNFEHFTPGVTYSAAYVLWHINALLDRGTQANLLASGTTFDHAYGFEQDAKRTRAITVGQPMADEETNGPKDPRDQEVVERFVCELANLRSPSQTDNRTTSQQPTDSDGYDDKKRRALIFIGLLGASNDSNIRGATEPFYHIHGVRMSGALSQLPNVWRAFPNEEIGFAFGYFKISKPADYPYDGVYGIIDRGDKPKMEYPNKDGDADARKSWYLPQILPVVREQIKRDATNPIMQAAFAAIAEDMAPLLVCSYKRKWVCRAITEEQNKAFTQVTVQRLGRVRFGSPDGQMPPQDLCRDGMRSFEGWKALRSGFLSSGERSGHYDIQVDLNVTRRPWWSEQFPDCK